MLPYHIRRTTTKNKMYFSITTFGRFIRTTLSTLFAHIFNRGIISVRCSESCFALRGVILLPPLAIRCVCQQVSVTGNFCAGDHVLLAQVLVECALEGETFAADLAVEGFVVCVAADVVLELIFASVLLAAELADEGRDAHVQTHVAVKAAFLIERFAAVDANEALVVRVPLATKTPLPYVIL